MGKLNKLPESDRQTIVNLYATGHSLKDIANKYSCTAPTVATFLKGEGVAIRGKGKVKKDKTVVAEPVEDMVEELDNDMVESYSGMDQYDTNDEIV